MNDKIQDALAEVIYTVNMGKSEKTKDSVLRQGFCLKDNANIIQAALTLALKLVQEDGKELKDCLFCGGDLKVGISKGRVYRVYCENCKITVNADHHKRPCAMKLYNTRHTPALDKFKEAVK